jgi:biopolymer transport protein ExbB
MDEHLANQPREIFNMASVAASSRPRLMLLLAALMTALFLFTGVEGFTPSVHAQDAAPADEGKDAAKDAEPDSKAPTAPHAQRSFSDILRHILKSVGWGFGFVLLVVSISLVTLVVLLIMELRLDAAIPPAFVEEFTETVNNRRFKEAYEMAKEDPSFVARVLTAGMSRLQYGIEDAREASYSMLESVKAGKEQLVVYVATIGTLGPLLGLVGTVFGMILSFMTLSSRTQINAQQLADDISHALVITLLGIGLSVPAIFCHAFFKNRLTRLTHDAGTMADDLLTQMYYMSKKAGASPAAAPEVPTRSGPPPVQGAVKPK